MITDSDNGPWINTAIERSRAMTLCVRVFFRSMDTETFSRLIAQARLQGQLKIVEGLYSAGVIANVVRAILGRIDKGHDVGDQVGDYVQDATVVLMQIARQGRLDLDKSAGEVASYICLWIEQRVKRIARKDQRWRYSLADSPDGIERLLDRDELQLSFPEPMSADIPDAEEYTIVDLPDPSTVHIKNTGFGAGVGYGLKKSERDILSVFGSSGSHER